MSDGLNEGQSEGLRDHLKQKREQKQQQQPRQRRLTYVAGLDGRRYVNDKILRNLEVQQHNSYGEYIAYATPDNAGAYQAYDPFQPIDPNELAAGYAGAAQQQEQPADDDDYQELHQEDLTYQEPHPEPHARNTWDESTDPPLGAAVSLNQAEVANADLENALQKARGSVHATYHDLSRGAFDAHARTESAPVQYESHGYAAQTGGMPPGYGAGSTGDVHATSYNGYQDPKNLQVFGEQAQQQQVQFAQQQLQQQQAHYAQQQAQEQLEQYQQQARHYQQTQQFDANKSAPPSVPLSSSASEGPAGSREEYKKMLGGLFKDELDEAPQEEPMIPQPPMEPDFSGAPETPQQQPQLSPQERIVLEAAQQQQAVAPAAAQQAGRPPRKTISIQKSLLGDDDDSPKEEPSPQAVRNRPKPNRIPIKIQRVAPPLPQQRNDEIYFEDNANSGKTSVFKMPKEGVVSSSRGTVELLVHKGGRMFRPHYNAVGILLRVDVSDGFSLIKGDTDKAHWLMTDRSGNPLDEEEIVGVAFDKKGNLWYETISGKKTKFLVAGGVEVTGDNKQS